MNKRRKQISKKQTFLLGFTLAEILVSIGILVFAWSVVTGIFKNGFLTLANNRARLVSLEIANDQLEIIRNMPYDSVGTTSGWPVGVLPSSQQVARSGQTFTIATRVDYVDDPFDGDLLGSISGKPVDTAPNDYKRADVTVSWDNPAGSTVQLSTYIVPSGVEAASNTGSFIIRVFDASGVGVPQATIRIRNSSLAPAIDITNTTDNAGNLQVIGLPPSTGKYNIVVSKNGYSSEQTYDPAVQSNPVRPDLSIIAGNVTQTSFAIDRVSTLSITTQGENCSVIGNVPLSLWGQKLIATNPDVKKFSSSPPTDANGLLSFTNLEWDNYTLIETSSSYDVAGVIPPILLNILPNTSQSIGLVLAPATSNSLHVTVKNAADGTTITGATVQLTKTGYDETKQTGVGYFSQTDWSGGAGQASFVDKIKYFDDDGNVDTVSTPGSLQLKSTVSTPTLVENFSDTTFKDPSTTAAWDGSGALELQQSAGSFLATGVAQSLKLNSTDGLITQAKLEAEENLNGQTATYELSADGGVTFESVTPGDDHVFSTTGSDLRFRVTLSTDNSSVTPSINTVTVKPTIVTYASAGQLTSSTFDTNNPSTTYLQLLWVPLSQVAGVGADSVRFQIATNSDNTTWNYVGPDGTSSTYFTTSGTDIPVSLDNNRYARIRIYLQTADVSVTPTVSFSAVGYTSGCVPPGQAFFPGLSAASYNLDVTAPGYLPFSSTASVNGATSIDVQLTPQ